MSRTTPALVLLAAGLLLAAGPAHAIYIVTPLTLSADRQQAEVGDTVTFEVGPQNETEQDAWAGRAVSVRYAYDPDEPREDATRSDEREESPTLEERVLQPTLALDERARATFTWTVPEEVRDHNVDVYLVADDGEKVAFHHLGVGNAPPQMRILAGSGPAGEEPMSIDGVEGAGGAPAQDDADEGESTGDARTPAPGAALALGAGLVAAALVVAARRK